MEEAGELQLTARGCTPCSDPRMSRAFDRFKRKIVENVMRAGISREEALKRMRETRDFEGPRCAITGSVAGMCIRDNPNLRKMHYDDHFAYFESGPARVTEATNIISLVAAGLFKERLMRESASLGIAKPNELCLGDYCFPDYAQRMETLLENGRYDIGVGVLTGAISHAVLAKLLGLDVIYVRAKRHGARMEFGPRCDLERIRGKRIFVIEDDISSGRTMRKVLSELRRFGPANIEIGLFINIKRDLGETFMGCKIAYDEAKASEVRRDACYDEEKEWFAIVRLLNALRQ